MTPVVTWISLIVGIICTAGAAAISTAIHGEGEARIDPPSRRTLMITSVFTAVITVLLFLATLPYLPPFSSGQRLGLGFLIGGIISAAAGPFLTMMFHRTRNADSRWPSYAAGIAAASTALSGVSLTFLIFSGYPQIALIGYAMASVMTAVFFRLGLSGILEEVDDDAVPVSLLGIEVYAVAAVTLAASTILAVERFAIDGRDWWPSVLLIFATVCLTSFTAASVATIRKVSEKPVKSYVVAALITVILTIGLTAIYVLKIYPDWRILYTVAIGSGAGLLSAWLIGTVSRERDNSGSTGLESAIMIVLVLLAAGMAAFRLLGGYGIGLSLVGAWATAIPAYGLLKWSDERPSLIPQGLHLFISTGTILLIYRLFAAIYAGELRELDLRAYYSFTAMILGAIVPFAVGTLLMRVRPVVMGVLSRLFAVGLIGLLSVISPLVVLIIWGLRAELGFLAGIAAAQAFMLLIYFFAASGIPGWGRDPVTSLKVNLINIGILLSASQFTGPLLPLLDMTRTQKAYVLAGALALAIVLTVVSWFVGRLERRGR